MTKSYNEHKEEAGVIYLGDHIHVNSGPIEIVNVTKEYIYVEWLGNDDVDWNKKFVNDLPFESEFKAKHSTERKYREFFVMNLDKSSEIPYFEAVIGSRY